MLTKYESNTTFASGESHAGEIFYSVLLRAHKLLRPRSYLEIGTATGASLALADCASIAIDPQFHIDCDIIGSKPQCMMFQTGSDQFFKDNNPIEIFKIPIDMAFLDGMHHFEFLTRDFYNTEKHCLNNSVIFMHDCVPTNSHIARRSASDNTHLELSSHPSWWAGDLWKFVMALQEYRPSLKLIALNAPPTGLIAITNLDPTSRVLEDSYFELVEKYRSLVLTQAVLDDYIASINLMDTNELNTFDQISKYFWL